MALATCTKAGLADAGACFADPSFTSHQRKAAIVYLLATITQAVGGEVDSTDLPELLRRAICLQPLNPSQREAAVIGILNGGLAISTGWTNTAGTISTLTREQLMTAIACTQNYTDEQLDLMLLQLLCNFFSAQA